MSEFHVEVVEIGKVGRLPNSDFLSITNIHSGYPVIFKTGDFNEGDLAVYIPVDAVVPDRREYSFLNGKRRIRAKRLRGVFSMGLLMPIRCTCPDWFDGTHQQNEYCPKNWRLGDNVQKQLGITKWEPSISLNTGGRNEKDKPLFLPIYTDIEGLRKYKSLVEEGRPVILLEKIHGTNFRAVWQENRLWVGSHNYIKKEDPNNIYWKTAIQYNLAEKLAAFPELAIYGEVYGRVQKGFHYDVDIHNGGSTKLRLFDIYDTKQGRYLTWDACVETSKQMGLDLVPELYRGPWSKELIPLYANGKSVLSNSTTREGFILRLQGEEEWHPRVGRIILKYPGEDYLLSKHHD